MPCRRVVKSPHRNESVGSTWFAGNVRRAYLIISTVKEPTVKGKKYWLKIATEAIIAARKCPGTETARKMIVQFRHARSEGNLSFERCGTTEQEAALLQE